MQDRHKQMPALMRWLSYILAFLFVLSGLYFTILGGYAITLGDTWYYCLMGIGILITGLLLFRLKISAIWLFSIIFIATLIWAWFDSGADFWLQVSNLAIFIGAGFLLSLIYPSMARLQGRNGKLSYLVSCVLFVAIAVISYNVFIPKNVIEATQIAKPVVPVAPGEAQQNWANWAQDTKGSRFAKLDQITPDNIDQLQVAWQIQTGDVAISGGSGAEDQNTPLQVGDSLYVCTPYGRILSLDVDTGETKWRFDPQSDVPNWQRCRSLGYYEDTIETAENTNSEATNAPYCSRRLFLPTGDARLLAINADNGELCSDFGDNGIVDLKIGMGEVLPGYYQQTSDPLVAGNLVVVGGRVADNFSTDEPPGAVRAYDVHSGELVWAWDPGNPEITKYPPEGETYTRGTPNVWAAMSYDPELNMIYLPTGNATPDFWAGFRSELDDKYSSSVVAVDAQTGQVRWHYQFVHHDLWDFDTPSQPTLIDVPDENGNMVPGLLQVTKQGEIFLLNRVTGEPIATVEERPVPQGNVEGERYSPTQPYSVGMPSLGNETLTTQDMWGATAFDRLICRVQFKSMRHEGVFTPPGLDHSLQMPGSLGGMNWGSVSFDPTLNYVFVNDMRLGLANYLLERKDIPASASGIEMGIVPMDGTPFGAMRMRFLSPLGVPCQKPPFGTMTAIDLETRQIAWQVPVGTVKDTGPFNIPMQLPIPIGMPTLGASLATQSGLVFFAGTQDFYLRAFDSRTGKEVWKARLPVGSQGGPMTYQSPKTGRQYVVITASGARMSPQRGDYVIAYSLPEAE